VRGVILLKEDEMAETTASDTHKTAKTQTQPSWTVMLYLAGDNNLSYDMVWAIKELYSVELPKNISITVQFDPLVGAGTRFYVRQGNERVMDLDGDFDRLGTKVPGPVNTGDPKVLTDFIEKSMRYAPAAHYALVLSGHGGGITGDFLTDYHPGPRSHAANGDHQSLEKGSLSIVELGDTLAKLPTKIDVLGMDSCLMSMAEVASEIGPRADNKPPQAQYLVASEGFVEATGWPYYRLLEFLKRQARTAPRGTGGVNLTAEACAISLVNRCVNYYADYRKAEVSFDMAVCQVNKILDVEDAVRAFVVEFLELTKTSKNDETLWNSVVLAHWKAQSYKWELYTDVWDFFTELKKVLKLEKELSSGHKLCELCDKVAGAVDAAVNCSRFAGAQFQHSHGLSIYFPWSEFYYANAYQETKFAKKTQWHVFLRQYFANTRRPTREKEAQLYHRLYPQPQDGWKKYRLNNVKQDGNGDDILPSPVNVRTNAPFGKTNAPFGKFFDLVVEATHSFMKNPARPEHDYLMLLPEELNELKEAIGFEEQKMKTLISSSSSAAKSAESPSD
jgi:hypothetical protein